jgi:hypothetical protein
MYAFAYFLVVIVGVLAIGYGLWALSEDKRRRSLLPVAGEYEEGFQEGREDAFREIHEILNGKSWTPDTTQEIADLVVRHGFLIDEPDE